MLRGLHIPEALRLRDLRIPWAPSRARMRGRGGLARSRAARAPYKAKEGGSVGTQAGRGDLFVRNRIPCGAQSRSQWAPESGTCLFDSAGVKRAAHWPGLTSQSQHRKCLADLNVRAPNLFWLPGAPPPGSAVQAAQPAGWERWHQCSGMRSPRPVSWALCPGGRSRVSTPETSRQREEPGVALAGGHRRVPGIWFHAPAPWRRAVRGPSLPDSPGRSLMGRHLLPPPPWCFRLGHWPPSQTGAQPAHRSHQGLQNRGAGAGEPQVP